MLHKGIVLMLAGDSTLEKQDSQEEDAEKGRGCRSGRRWHKGVGS